MKTYKLSKLYPSLPKNWEVGMIMEEIGANSYVPQDKKYDNKLLRKQTVETNPEYWEAVVKVEVGNGILRVDGRRIKVKTIDSTFSDIKMDFTDSVLTITITPKEPTPEIVKPMAKPNYDLAAAQGDKPNLDLESAQGNNSRLTRFNERVEDAQLRLLNGDLQKISDTLKITPENVKEIKNALQNYKNYWIGDNDGWITGWWSVGRQEMYIDGVWSNIGDYKRIILKPIQKPD